MSRCPICGQPTDPRGPRRPFCSERCQLVDLGAWLDGAYVIEGAAPDDPIDRADDEELQ